MRRANHRRNPERNRARILAAALEEFSRYGLGGARVDRIAARAGANKRMLYYYFGNKEDLFLAVLESRYAHIRRAEQGLRLGALDPARDVGMVFQAPLLLKWRRILENVLLPAEILGIPREKASKRARELLELVGLTGYEDKYPYELSGGMQQRAAIARSLVHDPKLVLMDEPFGALDALTREKMNLELLRIWKEAGKTIVFVTHGISEAVFLGTRVVVLTAGPAKMADNFEVELPHPRTLDMKTHQRFGDYTRRVYRLLGME